MLALAGCGRDAAEERGLEPGPVSGIAAPELPPAAPSPPLVIGLTEANPHLVSPHGAAAFAAARERVAELRAEPDVARLVLPELLEIEQKLLEAR